MKKKWMAFGIICILLIMFSVMLYILQPSYNSFVSSRYNDYVNDYADLTDIHTLLFYEMELLEANEYISILFDIESANQWHLGYKLINDTDDSYYYGHPFDLYIKYGNIWVNVPNEFDFNLALWHLSPHSYVEYIMRIDRELLGHNRFPPGEYRMIMTVYKNGNIDKAMPVVGGFTVHEVPGFDIYEPEEVYPPFSLTCCEMAVLKNETRDFRLDFRASESTDRYVAHSIHNHTEHVYLYRYSISLYVQRGSGWDAVPIVDEDYLSFSPPREIQPFDFVVVYLNYYDGMFGRLPPGEYRLVREVRRTLLGDVYPVVGRFTIFE